jgi:hypothetical protein
LFLRLHRRMCVYVRARGCPCVLCSRLSVAKPPPWGNLLTLLRCGPMAAAAASFAARKATILVQLREEFGDKSPKGSLDAPILDLVHYLNALSDYVRVGAGNWGSVLSPRQGSRSPR